VVERSINLQDEAVMETAIQVQSDGQESRNNEIDENAQHFS
jgi:hypothetical protein